MRGHHCSGQFGITPGSKRSRAEVFICQETILADLESSLCLVVGIIDGKYFSVEALGCSHVSWFLMLILVSAV